MDKKTKIKEAFKTALAMAVTYGIALLMGWDKPLWAGFAVAFCSLSTIGQSFNKAVLRMSGTLVATVAALTMIALFAQQRWLFILFLSTYVGFCTYLMGGAKHPYFWNICGFVCVIICMGAGPDSANAFQLAILRAQETGLGVLVYSLVSFLLWPTSSRAQFDATALKLASTQHQLYRSYLRLMKGNGDEGGAQTLKTQELQERTRFNQLLDAAQTDTYEVWEARRQWRRYQGQISELTEAMERWRGSFSELQSLDVQTLCSNIDSFDAEMDLRFTQIRRMLANQSPDQQPTAIVPVFDEAKFIGLSHFQKAALAVTRTRLQRMEALIRSAFGSICDIKSFCQPAAAVADVPRNEGFVLDPDRAAGVVRVLMTMWLAWFALVYIGQLPGGTTVLTMAAVLGMVVGGTPQLPISLFFFPVAVSTFFASVIYIFLMPQMSTFMGLGLLLFTVTFAICYLFAAPQQVLARLWGLGMFLTIASISNQQNYSFLVVANTALMFPVVFVMLAITACIPFSPRPERAFLRLLRRFFQSCEGWTASMRPDGQRPVTSYDRWKRAFHSREVLSLPQKLGAWAKFIDTRSLPGTSSQQVQQLVARLQAITYRLQDLSEASASPQASFLVQELSDDVRNCRLTVRRNFKRLSQNPAAGEKQIFQTGLSKVMEHLEARVKRTLDRAENKRFSVSDDENFYSLLGSYRGVCDALVDYAASAGAIDWTPWREERF
jgi:uncharacterized membrane protein YccC